MITAAQRLALTQLIQTHENPVAGNTVYLDNELPVESFVPFTARRFKNARLVWVNRALLRDYGVDVGSASLEELEPILLDAFAYGVPSDDDDLEHYGPEEKQFLGERYGATTEAANGGGVRCGLNGRFQIKGIGKNPLAATNVDHWHTYGGATLDEGVLEALWGELANQELPHGAVRLLALIATGKQVESNYGHADGIAVPAASALMIREANLRPAHYERATFYRPEEASRPLLAPDYVRVEKAAQRIHLALPNQGTDSVHSQLAQLFERIARQMASARSLRLVHGAITSSNIAIDGRYIDFGTMTALPDYTNHAVARGFPPFWDDQLQITDLIAQLHFFLQKYRPDLAPASRADSQKIFRETLQEEQALAFLRVAGVPRTVLALLARHAGEALFDAIRNILRKPLNIIPPTVGPDSVNVFTALMGTAFERADSLTVDDILDLVPAPELAAAFVQAFVEFVPALQTSVVSAGLEWSRFLKLARLQATKFDQDLTALYHWTVVLDTQRMRETFFTAPDETIAEINDYLRTLIDGHARAEHALPPHLLLLGQSSLRAGEITARLVFDIHLDRLFVRIQNFGPPAAFSIDGGDAVILDAQNDSASFIASLADLGQLSLSSAGSTSWMQTLSFPLSPRMSDSLRAVMPGAEGSPAKASPISLEVTQ
ncbi:protein adenylyltransferase SelO family protein [Jeongeupia chitinilytica]|uniref:Uncharacterized protein n=1 Tax=Jeongeupia chitinilytica TaxID=1041641 RepID=A0ABQ3H2J9_9NEIS|nr:protein adenylyltransferase SelO family protein [Jeongeupia chitinilytica]GHD64291.1 hypothetical protein GCM10007350_23140 [Jeongeupia chitinilytica]